MKTLIEFIPPVDMERLFTALPDLERSSRWGAKCFLVRFMLGTGARIGEVAALRREHCDADGIIAIERTKTGRGRRVQVSPELRPHYLRYIANVPNGPLFPAASPRRMSVDETGPLTTRALAFQWDSVLRECGVKHYNPHCARHSYATYELASRRLQPNEVMSQLGHKSIETTYNHYAHALTLTLYQEDKTPAWWKIARGDS